MAYHRGVRVIASLGTSAAGSSTKISSTPPTSPRPGNLWFNSIDGKLYIYYDDGDSSQWIPSNT